MFKMLQMKIVKPQLIPHHKNMHLLKPDLTFDINAFPMNSFIT